MPGQRPLLAMSFLASVGITLDVLACTFPKGSSNFWPLIVFIFYFLVPLPLMITNRINKDIMASAPDPKARDLALFFTAGIMISTMALPTVLSRSAIITWAACALVSLGNILCFMTIGLFCLYFGDK